MKFTKPINREIDIEGNTFIVSLSDNGIEFRLKGKRKTAQVEWVKVLDIAEGEQGAGARDHLGIGGGQSHSRQQQPEAQRSEASPETPHSEETEPHTHDAEAQSDTEYTRSVSAGEVGPES